MHIAFHPHLHPTISSLVIAVFRDPSEAAFFLLKIIREWVAKTLELLLIVSKNLRRMDSCDFVSLSSSTNITPSSKS